MPLTESQKEALRQIRKRLGDSDETLAKEEAAWQSYVPFVNPDPPPEPDRDEIDEMVSERRRGR
jgi:hypothetical protein